MNFDRHLHDHLITLRNTLIAHDDLTEIEPTFALLALEQTSADEKIALPLQAYLRNKCLSYPNDVDVASSIHRHIKTTFAGIANILRESAAEMRDLYIRYPSEYRLVSENKPPSHVASFVGDGVTTTFRLDLSSMDSHPYLDVQVPEPPTALKQYAYTTCNFGVDFVGPQKFPDGQEFSLRNA